MNIPYLSAFYLCMTLTVTSMAQTSLPASLYADSAHAPFLWGVASGDPLPDGIVLWTRTDPDATQGATHTVAWEVATDAAMTSIVANGSIQAEAQNDHCARVEVSGLTAGATYYYRFRAENDAYSVIGRTRTAPLGATAHLKFAVTSCSSVFSGFFNGYDRIAERNDLDLVVHLGDYVYDTVDPDEEVRVPSPYPVNPDTEDEWRERHRLYLLDPALRAARQMHPWVVVWDNHDFKRDTVSGVQAFWEYVPRRDVHSDISKIYRTYSYGDLVDLTMIDIQQYRGRDTIAPGEASTLGHEQRQWYLNTLGEQTAKWHITGNQKMFGGWYSEGIPEWIPVPNDGGVFSRGSWDGYMAERDTVLSFVQENNIDNFVVLSGDAHMSFGMDLSREPRNGNIYDATTGNGSLGVEFLPTSITRGNFDESGVPTFAVPIFESASNGINPHHRYTEFTEHGYGILNIDHDSIVAEWWYVPILQENSSQELGMSMTVGDRQNRWKRASGFAPLGINAQAESTKPLTLFPNPSSGRITVQLADGKVDYYDARVMNMLGEVVYEMSKLVGPVITLNVDKLKSGTYLLELSNGQNLVNGTFVIATK
jgi:alkaline phosphatase D